MNINLVHSITANAVNPGGVRTELQQHLTYEDMRARGYYDEAGNLSPNFKTPEQGAATTVWASVAAELAGIGGLYLEDCQRGGCIIRRFQRSLDICLMLSMLSRFGQLRRSLLGYLVRIEEEPMSFAVQLYFDLRSDTVIRSLWEAIASKGVPFPLQDSGNRPHFSLAIYEKIDVPVCADRLNMVAQTLAPFTLSIASLGIFSAEKTVVFLAPVVSPGLLSLHRQVHEVLRDVVALPAAYYLPGHWTPHCTLATRVPPQFLPQVVEIGLGVSFPRPVSIEEIGIIEYPPVTHLCSFGLMGA